MISVDPKGRTELYNVCALRYNDNRSDNVFPVIGTAKSLKYLFD